MLEPDSLPQAINALNTLALKVLTVFTGNNGHAQLNIGVSFSPFLEYTRQNCPVYNAGRYGQARGPGCVGPGTGTGPTSSGPLMVHPQGMRVRGFSAAGRVTTNSDRKTLGAALNRKPGPADTLMLGPLVRSSRAMEKGAKRNGTASNGDKRKDDKANGGGGR